MNRSIAIIGMGRFGQCFAELLKPQFDIVYLDRKQQQVPYQRVNLCDLHRFQHVILCVPINTLETVLKSIAPQLSAGTTVIDTASVKVLPTQWMLNALPSHIECIATHPLFGPDSYPDNTNIVMHAARCQPSAFNDWQTCLQQLGLHPIVMTPEQHDQEVSVTQSITHYVGRLLDSLALPKTEVATQGYRRLQQLQQQTCEDSLELFADLIRFNPYSADVINVIEQRHQQLQQQLEQQESHHGQQ